jgi:hypothetical protein
LEVIVISHTSLPHTPIKRTRRNRSILATIASIILEHTPLAFSAATPLPALVSCKRNGRSFMASVDKTKDLNGHLFARVQFADGAPMWTNASNIVEVVG